MKRKFDEISNEKGDTTIYDSGVKRRKIQSQRIGDFIVDAKKAFHFRLYSSVNADSIPNDKLYFSPKFMHFIFGKNERISGYEGLSVDVALSPKRLIPFVTISYESKAPSFANIDNIEEKLQKQFGRIYTSQEQIDKVLEEEKGLQLPGEKLSEFKNQGNSFEIRKISLSEESFHEQSFYLQAILPFFIDGASVIEPCPFWNYFLIYEKQSGDLIAYTTVYEAHHSFDKFRAKVSQVLVLPTFQRRGFGQQLYNSIYNHYAKSQPKCFEIIVEDSSDDFQKILDLTNVKTYLEYNKQLRQALKKQPMSDVILNEEAFKSLYHLSPDEILKAATELKLPQAQILRLHDIVIYSSLDKNELVQKAFRLAIKKKYYLPLARQYPSLVKDLPGNILEQQGGLLKPYIYSEETEEGDPFFRIDSQEEQKNEKALEGERIMTQEAMKMQLKTVFEEIQTEFNLIKEHVRKIVSLTE